MSESLKMVPVPALDAERIKTLEAYSNIESWLALLLSILLDVPPNKGYLIFYRITNTRSRYAILCDLIKLTKDKPSIKHWKHIEEKLKVLDPKRNQLVHWTHWYDIETLPGPNEHEVVEILQDKHLRPGHKSSDDITETLTVTDLQKLRQQADVMTFIVKTLTAYCRSALPAETIAALREIYLQPLTDQTLGALQQCLNPKEPEPPPQPSEA